MYLFWTGVISARRGTCFGERILSTVLQLLFVLSVRVNNQVPGDYRPHSSCSHYNPREVLISGCGSDGVVRVALRHPTVREITLRAIDEAWG